jgi:t-SNARE complex subunit (syntaxin)
LNKNLDLSKQQLNEVQERNKELEQLEKNIIELHEMFKDMQELVESQGHTIDNIEANVNQTKDYVLDSKPVLKESVDLKRAARRVRT